MTRGERAYLGDMLAEAERIGRFIEGLDEHAFLVDELRQYAVMHAITLLGEAARRISDEGRLRHPALPWRQIISMRSVLIHEYGHVELRTVWEAAHHAVPALVPILKSIVEEER